VLEGEARSAKAYAYLVKDAPVRWCGGHPHQQIPALPGGYARHDPPEPFAGGTRGGPLPPDPAGIGYFYHRGNQMG
jgi:hypothetical protein